MMTIFHPLVRVSCHDPPTPNFGDMEGV